MRSAIFAWRNENVISETNLSSLEYFRLLVNRSEFAASDRDEKGCSEYWTRRFQAHERPARESQKETRNGDTLFVSISARYDYQLAQIYSNLDRCNFNEIEFWRFRIEIAARRVFPREVLYWAQFFKQHKSLKDIRKRRSINTINIKTSFGHLIVSWSHQRPS